VVLRSLRSLTIAFLSAFLISTVGTGFAIYSATRATIAHLADKRIAAASKAVAGTSPHDGAADILQRIEAFEDKRDTGDLGFMLLDAQGRRLGGNVSIRRILPMGYSTIRRDDRIAGLAEGRALVRPAGHGLTLTTIAETELFSDYKAARIQIYLLGFGSIVLVVVSGLIAFGLLIRRRIAEIRWTVDAIIDGDMQRRVPMSKVRGEFARQALAFNRMLDRIAELMSGISNVSNDIAHDLRTPLARLRSQLARLARQAETPALRAGLDGAIAQSDQLLAMFAAVLRIAEVEGGDRRAGFEPIDLGALAREVGAVMQPVASESGHELLFDACELVAISGDRQLLTQVLINLIENGLRYTPAGSRITIGSGRSVGSAILTVSDDGPGITPGERAEALRRFGRLDKSRHLSGHGLGLPLVEAVMRLHRGGVALEDAMPGLRVVLSLPVA
jgi:signal transduction histidine kinase